MKKLFLFLTAVLFTTSLWATDISVSFIDGYTATYDVSTSVTGFGNVYFASRSGITKNTPTDHTNYRTPKGNYVFELTQPSTIDITLYNTSSGRTVMIGLYTMDATVFSVWQNAANQNKNMLTWLIDNKTSYAADGETTLETYFSDKLKQSSGTIASGSDNEKALMPEATTSADGMSTYAQNLYTKYWRHESAASLNRNEPTIVSLNGGEPVPAGKYIMTIGDSGSNMGIEKITITPAASYTITYDANGGEGEMENSTNTISACTFTAPDGYEFKEWNTAADGKGTSYAAGATATSDLDLYAIWQVHATSSDATLSALSVAGCTLSPAFASGTTAYTIALPFYASMPAVGDVTATKNDSFAKDPKVTIADNVISIACEAEDGTKQTYTITVNIADVPAASTSINIEQLVLDNSKSYSYTTALTAANISYANLNGLDSLAIGDADHSRPDYNESFLGLKIKKSGGYIQMVIPSGKTLKVKFGSVAADLKLTINDVPQTDISKSTSVYEHTATGNELIKIATSSDKTVVIKQIMIDEDIAVVRPFEATIAATTNGTASVELAKYAKGEEVTVNCVPASGYKLASIAVSGYDDKGAETDVTVTGNKFTMPGSPVTITVTFSIATSIDNTSDAEKAQKRIENGQLVIEKNGKVFNAMGQTIR